MFEIFSKKIIQKSCLLFQGGIWLLKYKNFQSSELKIKNFKVIFADRKTALNLIFEIFFYQPYYFFTAKKSPFIIDAGANIGISVLFFKYIYPNAKLIAFEPDTNSFKILNENIKRNMLKSVKLLKLALSAKSGLRPFFRDISGNNFVGMSLSNRFKNKALYAKKSYVKCVKLSKLIKTSIDLLKLDVEGEELSILNNLSQTKKIAHIQNLVLEFHEDEKTKFKLIKILKILEKNSFKIGFQKRIGIPFSNNAWGKSFLIYAKNMQNAN